MGGWLRQIALNAQVQAGLSGGLLVWAALALVACILALTFLLIAGFVWLSDLYGTLIAGLALGIFFLVLTLIAVFACLAVRRHNIERARLELEVRRSSPAGLLDPKLMAVGYQLGQAIGWRKLASLAAVGVLAAGLAREWLVHRQDSPHADNDSPQP